MKLLLSAPIILLVSILTSFQPKEEWVPLLDKDLSQWEIYQGFPPEWITVPGLKKDDKGNYTEPIGLNKNINRVFTVTEENGKPVLRVSGEIYGCVGSKKEYENYHLKLQVKWGSKKWAPRLDLEKDSGILYHSIGEYGVDYWKAWALSQEFQIIEGGMGDFWCIASSKIDIPASKPSDNGDYIYTSGGKMVTFGPGNGFCRRKYAPKLEKEGWNTLELICYGDKSLHLVNGEVVMALTNSRYTQNGREIPLTKGRLQLQSEAAEVFFKDIKIKNINRMPAQYRSYFK